MKRIIVFAWILVFVLLLGGCANTENSGDKTLQNPPDTAQNVSDTTDPTADPIDSNPVQTVKGIESITDHSIGMELPDLEEPFFEDDSHIYIFGNPISQYVIVKYTDESAENVKEALESGRVQITDLDKYNINYFAEPKHIENIVDLTENGEISTADALEGFFRDDRYVYYFPSIKSKYITVCYKDGSEQPVKEALAEGEIRITDLDWFGIQYYKEPLENFME